MGRCEAGRGTDGTTVTDVGWPTVIRAGVAVAGDEAGAGHAFAQASLLLEILLQRRSC
jgi:hypothetical protein